MQHALGRLAERLSLEGEEEVTAVLLVTVGKDRRPQYSLHGSIEVTDLAFVGAAFMKWATEHVQ